MARFSYEQADNYGAQKNSFFTLKDDGESAIVRFLLNDINDLEGVATHEIQIGDRKMDVECLRAYNEPIENCPLCAANYKVNAKLFIPIYDETSKESKIWTRGKTFFRTMSGLCSRYKPLVSTPFEIVRQGKKGDTSTTYATYAQNRDNAKIEDFPEIEAEGLTFQSKSFEDLQYFLQNGVFPEDNQQPQRQSSQPVRNTTSNTMPVRRRPAYTNNEDTF